MVDHVLKDYFKRDNAFVVSNTFQILEHLSRAIWAKGQGRQELGGRFLKLASNCLGHHPERDLQAILTGQESQYELFAGEYASATFFRPPIAE